jgi:hypothetical protein
MDLYLPIVRHCTVQMLHDLPSIVLLPEVRRAAWLTDGIGHQEALLMLRGLGNAFTEVSDVTSFDRSR